MSQLQVIFFTDVRIFHNCFPSDKIRIRRTLFLFFRAHYICIQNISEHIFGVTGCSS